MSFLIAVSIHARLATGDADGVTVSGGGERFQFTPVLRRATAGYKYRFGWHGFNSRPSCDGRLEPARLNIPLAVSIHARLATGDVSASFPRGGVPFQFTPVLRRATPAFVHLPYHVRVSIHARLATGDHSPAFHCGLVDSFNSRPSCDGRHVERRVRVDCHCFNSRPSCDGRRY